MALELRDTGISVVGDVPWGTHICSFYDTKRDLLDILIPFFKTGLEINEFCLWIVSKSELLTMQEARKALQEVLPDVDVYVGEKSIEFAGHDWFLNGGSFDFRRVANRFKEKGNEALARGYVGMRVNGSPAWLETSNGKELREFEAEVDQLYRHERIIASCTYAIGWSRADFLLDVARNHRFAIARRNGIWDIVETPEVTQAKAEIERLNVELEQRVIDRSKKLEQTATRLRAEIEERKEAEGAVRQSEERFAAFMDNLPGYAWMKDLQGRYVYGNEMVKGLPGYESLGKTDAQIWPADLAAEYRANDKQVIATKRPLQTVEHFQQEGKQRYMAGSKFPIFDKTGAVALVGGAGVDITERIEAEEALRESEEKFRQLAENIREVFWMTTLHLEEVLYVSPAYESVWGRSLASLRQRPQSFMDSIHNEDRERVVGILEGQRQQGFEVEYRIVRPDGSVRWIRDRGFPVKDASGKVYRIAGVAEDITERKRVEMALQKNEQLLSETQVLGRTGSWEHNLVTGEIANTEGNLRLFFGDDHSKGARFEDFAEVVHQDDREYVSARHAQLLAEGGPRDIEYRVVWPDGTVHVLFGRATVVRDAAGRPLRVYGTNVDITERQQAENALRDSGVQLQALSRRLVELQESERKELARELHDRVGQSLTALKINIDILQPALASQGNAEVLARVADSAALLESTMDTIENVMSELRPPMLDDHGLAAALDWHARNFSKRTGIGVAVRVGEPALRPAPQVEIALFRAAREALNNVAKHARARRVEIALDHANGEYVMSVQDDGIGFDGVEDASDKPKPGLGMVTMRERAQAVGGHFEVQGLPDRGTQLTVRVPR